MSQTLVNIRMDSDLKKAFDMTCAELGMSMSTAFNIFARKMTREKRIPFEVSIDPFYSESNMQALKRSIEQSRAGEVVTKTFAELEEMEDE